MLAIDPKTSLYTEKWHRNIEDNNGKASVGHQCWGKVGSETVKATYTGFEAWLTFHKKYFTFSP